MRKLITSITAITLVALVAANTLAGSMDFYVDSESSTATTSATLTNGVQYLIEVSGTWEYWDGDEQHDSIADAEWWKRQNGNGPWKEDFRPWDRDRHDLFVGGLARDWLGTTDGVNFSANTYSPDHIYRLYLDGEGTGLDFLIYDSKYSDNYGSLQVAISEVPEPATMVILCLGGLSFICKRRMQS